MAMCCAYLTLCLHFASPKFRHYRVSFYASLGLASHIVFVVHGLVIHGWEEQKTRISLKYTAWVAMSNLVGAVIYAARVSLS